MTAEANTKWDHDSLQAGVRFLGNGLALLHNTLGADAARKIKQLLHTIDFIEYNMHEMEINGGNGD